MKSNLYFGKNLQGKDIWIDLQKENLHTIIFTGQTGSGKSILHYHLYKQLIEQNTEEELGFVFFDMTRVDFSGWRTPFLYLPTVVDPRLGLTRLAEIGEESKLRASGKTSKERAIFIHIEECDMVVLDKKRFVNFWLEIFNNKNKNNIYVVFSTSRPAPDVLTKEILENTDLKVVFTLASKEDSGRVLGKSLAENFNGRGEKVLVYNQKEILSQPLTMKEVGEASEFDKKMASNNGKAI